VRVFWWFDMVLGWVSGLAVVIVLLGIGVEEERSDK